MGKFLKEELLILEKSVEQIEIQISVGIYDNGDKDKMLFASCLNDKEKEELTKKEIKKQQKKLAKCPANISVYITAYINPSKFDIGDDDYDQYRERIIGNYVESTFIEVCENLLENKFTNIKSIESENETFWEVLIESNAYGVEENEISDFIKYMIIADRLKGYKSILESIEIERYVEEQIKKDEDGENEFYILFDKIRENDYTELQLYEIIKEHTQLNKDAMQYLYKDIELYLFGEKDSFECKYSEDETEQAIEDLKAKGYTEEELIRLKYIKKRKKNNLKNDMNIDEIYINKELLFFPLEFNSIYNLQGLINVELHKIKEKEEQENPKIQTTPKLKLNLSVPQLALLFKMINDLKPKIFNTKSDAELFRFISSNFQTKKSSDKGISTQKLRNEFNNPELKSIEFWETHLHTMLSNIRKLKYFF